MTDELAAKATASDQAAAFFRALSGAVRVTVHRPNALGMLDLETFDPAAVEAEITALRDKLARTEVDRIMYRAAWRAAIGDL